ncbi:MAG: hypothetical protein KGH72_04855 [Candidatus Micrarchaeota archaeon]|nr:hypothetical protein [Candidatus Micrarchaeota archaeon]
MFKGIFNRNQPGVKVTAVNIKFLGETHGLAGLTPPGNVFSYDLPFQNKIGSDLLIDDLKGPKMTVSGISVREPFKLLEASPKPPVEVPYLEKVTFKLKIEAPMVSYEGPLAIDISSGSNDSISMSVKKVTLHYKDVAVDLEDSAMLLPIHKGQVFRKRVQLYKVMSYRMKLDGVDVNKPFEVVGTQPKLPLSLDKKDSYLLDIFIKAPDFNYAGNLDLTFR